MKNKQDLEQAGSNFIKAEAGNIQAESEKKVVKRELSKNIIQDSQLIFKLNHKYKEKLQTYFKEKKGLSLSAGVRQILFDFMHDNNII